MTQQIKMIHEMAIDSLVEQLRTELREFWERHDEAAEYDEDQVPNERKAAASSAIIGRAKYDFENRTLKQLHPLIGESRHANSMRASMIEHYLDDAADAVQNYFDNIVYRLQR